ncbi:MAG: DUF4124 domain-containing protein [Gammaproteobacteria bacterium]
MQRPGAVLLILALAAGGLMATARPAAASDPGIPVYTWTDANGVTHFSDTPRSRGPTKTLVLPTPPPPNQTAIAAQRAWVHQLNLDSQKELAQQAARRRADQQAEATASQRQNKRTEVVQYVPTFYPSWYHRRYRHDHRHERRVGNLPSARFPSNALPSSFPPGLPSSFPEEPSFWPPRH